MICKYDKYDKYDTKIDNRIKLSNAVLQCFILISLKSLPISFALIIFLFHDIINSRVNFPPSDSENLLEERVENA